MGGGDEAGRLVEMRFGEVALAHNCADALIDGELEQPGEAAIVGMYQQQRSAAQSVGHMDILILR
jgi:hypothetical protein